MLFTQLCLETIVFRKPKGPRLREVAPTPKVRGGFMGIEHSIVSPGKE